MHDVRAGAQRTADAPNHIAAKHKNSRTPATHTKQKKTQKKKRAQLRSVPSLMLRSVSVFFTVSALAADRAIATRLPSKNRTTSQQPLHHNEKEKYPSQRSGAVQPTVAPGNQIAQPHTRQKSSNKKAHPRTHRRSLVPQTHKNKKKKINSVSSSHLEQAKKKHVYRRRRSKPKLCEKRWPRHSLVFPIFVCVASAPCWSTGHFSFSRFCAAGKRRSG